MTRTRLHILVISHEYPPVGGGASVNAKLLCDRLAAEGHQVEVWTTTPVGNRQKVPYKIRSFLSTRSRKFETNTLNMLFFIIQSIALFPLAIFNRPNIILSIMGIPGGLAGHGLHLLTGVKHVIWNFGSEIHAGRPEGPKKLQQKLIGFVSRKAAKNLFVSPDLQHMAERFASIPNSGILPTSATIQGCDFDASQPRPYILYLGRMEPVKNPLVFVQAIRKLFCENALAGRKALMIGGGDLYDEVINTIESNHLKEVIEVIPSVPHDEVWNYFKQAYLFVITSLMEGFPTTVIEAARFCTPTVGSDVLGIRQVIDDGKTGLLFKDGDSDHCASCISKVLRDKVQRNRMGIAAKSASLQYTPEENYRTFLRQVSDIT